MSNLMIISNKEKSERDSSIELLRIIAMVLIIAHHFAVHGKFDSSKTIIINNIWLQILASGAKVGVNTYILISGYYLIETKKIYIDKVLKLLFQMIFYSVIIYIITIWVGIEKFDISVFFINFLGYPMWWFGFCYLELYLIHTYINKFLNTFDKKSYQRLIVYLTILFSVVPTLTGVPFDSGNLIWFIYLYCVGGYLKKYPIKLNWSSKRYLLVSCLIYIINILIVIISCILKKNVELVSIHPVYFFGIQNIGVVLISILVFIGFSKLKMKYNNIINIIASTTFGIYLIHDYPFVRIFLWEVLFKNCSYSDTILLIPYSILAILYVFIVCSIIELIRKQLLEKQYMKIIKKVSKSFENNINNLLKSNILNRI